MFEEFTVSGTIEFTAYFEPRDLEAYLKLAPWERKEMLRKEYLKQSMEALADWDIYAEGVTITDVEERDPDE